MQQNMITAPEIDAEKRMRKDIEYVHLLYPWKSTDQIEKVVARSGSLREALRVLEADSKKKAATMT
ncbi:MAG TPA: hypothetical protein VFV68_07320 [Agriterribacter sp.]|nr:hypothetical protein [Agriterribacter sp.]